VVLAIRLSYRRNINWCFKSS